MAVMKLEHLEKVLQDFAKDIRENYKEHLEFHDHFTRLGSDTKLKDSLKTDIQLDAYGYHVTLSLNDYWKYVEEGVQGRENSTSPYKNPGWKAYPHILKWVEIKPIIPKPGKNGKIPKPESLAYLITRSIVQNGTQGTHDYQVTKDNVIAWYNDRIEEALREDMKTYVKQLIVE